jgi:hypothetical protein
VTAYALDPKAGTLSPLQTAFTLPKDFMSTNACAETRVHPSGKCLIPVAVSGVRLAASVPRALGSLKRPMWSHGLSLVGFWGPAFFYPLTGIRHFLYTPIPMFLQYGAVISTIAVERAGVPQQRGRAVADVPLLRPAGAAPALGRPRPRRGRALLLLRLPLRGGGHALTRRGGGRGLGAGAAGADHLPHHLSVARGAGALRIFGADDGPGCPLCQ